MPPYIILLLMHGGCEVLALIRNIALARILGASEFGVTAMLAITLRLLEMGSDLATDRLMIQNALGNRPSFQATAQGIEVLRGVLAAAILCGLAVPVSYWFGKPAAWLAFALLGLVPLLKGWAHLDFRRMQRERKYSAAATVELSAASASLLACIPLGFWLQDYRTVLGVFLVQALTFVCASHSVAKRRYRIAFVRSYIATSLRFGIPLAANGLMMFMVFQGDKLIVGLSTTAEELARYAISAQLGFIPVLVFSRIASSYFLPTFARCESSSELQSRVQDAFMLLSVAATIFGLVFLLFGNSVLRLLYGNEFTISTVLLGCLTLLQMLRLLRGIPSVLSIAQGESWQPLVVNVVRSVGVLATAYVGWKNMGLIAIALSACVGELMALLFSVALIHRTLYIRLPTPRPACLLGLLAFVFWWSRSLAGAPSLVSMLFGVTLTLAALWWLIMTAIESARRSRRSAQSVEAAPASL